MASLTVQTFWLMLARTAAFAFSVALPVILVRVFDRTEFGLYRQIFLLLTTAQNILPFGFPISAFYYLPREREHRSAIILNILLFLGFTGALAAVILMVWPDILQVFLGHNLLRPYAPLMGLILLLLMFSGFLESVATANQDVRYSTTFIITAQLTKTIFMVAAAAIFRTVEALLYAALCQGVAQSAILLWYLGRTFSGYWRSFDLSLLRQQLMYVLPFGLSGLLYTVQTDFHSYVVANRFSAADYALYSVGSAQLPLITLLRNSLRTVLLTRISSLHHREAHDEIKMLVLRAVRKLSIFYLPACAILIVLGREFLVTFYTAQYAQSWPILVLNSILLMFNVLPSDPIFRTYAGYGYYTVTTCACMIAVMIPLTFAGIHQFGMIGAMAALLVTMGAQRVWLFALALRAVGATRKDWAHVRGIVRIAVSTVIASAAAWLTRELLAHAPAPMVLIPGSLIFVTTYVAGLVLLGAIDTDEKMLINQYSNRFLGVALLRP